MGVARVDPRHGLVVGKPACPGGTAKQACVPVRGVQPQRQAELTHSRNWPEGPPTHAPDLPPMPPMVPANTDMSAIHHTAILEVPPAEPAMRLRPLAAPARLAA